METESIIFEEETERMMKREIEQILKIPVTIGIPDPDWIKKAGYPCGSVIFNSAEIHDVIEDGLPDFEIDQGNNVVQFYVLADANIIISFHLFHEKKAKLSRLTSYFLREFLKKNVLNIEIEKGYSKDYTIGRPIAFRDELPGPEESRIFERIFAIPLTGDIYETIIVEKGSIEFVLEVDNVAKK